MAGCIHIPCKFDKKGKVVPSKLFMDLQKLFKGNRELQTEYYSIATDNRFIEKYGDQLTFDENGEVTLESFLEVSQIDVKTEQMLQYLNKLINEGEYNYEDASTRVSSFNRNPKYSGKYLATMSKTSKGKYRIHVVERTIKEEDKLKDIVREMSFRERLIYMLKQHGVSVEFLDSNNESSVYNTKEFKAIDGFVQILHVVNNEEVDANLAEEAGHFILGALGENHPLVKRLLDLLTPEMQDQILGKDSNKSTGESYRREIAGHLIGQALLSKNYELYEGDKTLGIIGRIVNRIINAFKKLYSYWKYRKTPMEGELYRMQLEAEKIAQEMATDFMVSQELGMSLDKALATREILYSAKDSGNVKAYKESLVQLKRMVDAIRSIGDKHLEETLGELLSTSVEGTLNVALRRSPIADQMTLNSCVYMLQQFLDMIESNDIMDMLSTVDLNTFNRLTPEQYQRYGKTLQKVRAYLQYSSEIAKILNDAILADSSSKNNLQIDPQSGIKIQDLKDLISKVSDSNTNAMSILQSKERGFFLKFCEDIYGKPYIYKAGGLMFGNPDPRSGQKSRLGMYVRKSGRVALNDCLETLEDDMGYIRQWFTSTSNSNDIITQIMDRSIKYYKRKAELQTAQDFDEVRKLEEECKSAGIKDTDIFYERFRSQYSEEWYEEYTKLRDEAWATYLGKLRSDPERWKTIRSDQIESGFQEYFKPIEEEFHKKNSELSADGWVPSAEYKKTHGEKGFTGNLIQAYRYGEWEMDFRMFQEECRAEFRRLNAKALEKSTDLELALAWDNYFHSKYTQFHKEHSIYNENLERYIPNDSYINEDYAKLDNKAKGILKKIMELKARMDARLPDRCTESWRAPQFRGSYISNVSKQVQMNTTLHKAIGVAFMDTLRDKFCDSVEDSAEFGSDSNYNNPEDRIFEDNIAYQREKIGRIPLYGINKLKDKRQLSTNIFHSLVAYSTMSNTFQQMNEVVSSMEVGRQVMLDRKVPARDGSKDLIKERDRGMTAEHTRVYRRATTFLDKELYGKQSDKSKLGKVIIQKIASALNVMATYCYLGWNYAGGVVNAGTGFFQALIEACTGEEFTIKDFIMANKDYFGNLIPGSGFYQSNLLRQHDDSDIGAFTRYFNVREMNNMETSSHNNYSSLAMKLIMECPLLPYKLGDHMMQNIAYLAVGRKITVYQKQADGTMKAIPLVEAYQTVTESIGKEVVGSKKIRRLEQKPDIYKYKDSVKYIEVLNRIKNKVDQNQPLELLFTEDLTEEEIEVLNIFNAGLVNTRSKKEFLKGIDIAIEDNKFSTKDETAFIARAREVSNRMFGIYNSSDKVGLQSLWYYNLCTAMKGYALGMVNRRFSSSTYIAALNKEKEGSLLTFAKLLVSTFAGLDGSRGAIGASNTYITKQKVYNEDTGEYEYKDKEITIMGENLRKSNAFVSLLSGLFLPLIPPIYRGKGKNNLRKQAYRQLLARGFSPSQVRNLQKTGMDYLIIGALYILRMIAASSFSSTDDDDDDEKKKESLKYNGDYVMGWLYYFSSRWLWENSAFNDPTLAFSESQNLLGIIPPGLALLYDLYDTSRLLIGEQFADPENSEYFYQNENKYGYIDENGELVSEIHEYDSKGLTKLKKLVFPTKILYQHANPVQAYDSWEYGNMVKSR